jgi:hypothetical protein
MTVEIGAEATQFRKHRNRFGALGTEVQGTHAAMLVYVQYCSCVRN